MIHILYAEVKDDFKIFVEFSDGTKGIVDFEKIIKDDHRKIINDLMDKNLFKTVKVCLNTLCWDNEADFAPEFLHSQIVTSKDNVA